MTGMRTVACLAFALIVGGVPAAAQQQPQEQTGRTMADGLRTNSLGPLPFEHLRRFMDEIVTVSEDQMADAIRQLAHRARLVVEPSGAASMAAHLSGAAARTDGDDARVIVISGGNVDPEQFLRLLAG